MHLAQIIITIIFAFGFLANLFWDVEGRAEKKPTGFGGVLVTVIVYAFLLWLYVKAGAFSTLF